MGKKKKQKLTQTILIMKCSILFKEKINLKLATDLIND